MKRLLLLIIFIAAFIQNAKAFDDGIVNLTRRRGNTEGCSCHNLTPYPEVSVRIIGPSSVRAGDTVEFKLKITGGPLVRAGCDISAANGRLILSPADTMLQRVLAATDVYELTHVWPKLPGADTVTFIFKYIAPNTPDSFDTLYANGNSVNFNGTPDGDKWNYADDKIITITSSVNVRNISSIADGYKLYQNYPNPFNPVTKFKFNIAKLSDAKIVVYDISGHEVKTLVNESLRPGAYEVTFDGSNLSSGVYFYQFTVNNKQLDSKKMLLVK
ncbi:MAG: T9SS type A sorting domain-containing protein [Ignavibacteria bacterium]|nr:T9SS type A sorting domain-containing protein [Ignavibacteria bacterium]